jgi:uncharacterized membrane protein YhaH (DUF805 family)
MFKYYLNIHNKAELNMNPDYANLLPFPVGAVFYLFLAFIINKLIKGQSPLHEQSKKIFINWNKFKGVTNRADFIVGTLLYASFMMAFATLFVPFLTVDSGELGIEFYSVLIVFIIGTMFLSVSFLSLQIRRFHDGNVSGWIYLLLTVLTIIFSIMAEEFEIEIAAIANIPIGIAFLYFLFIRKTHKESNLIQKAKTSNKPYRLSKRWFYLLVPLCIVFFLYMPASR